MPVDLFFSIEIKTLYLGPTEMGCLKLSYSQTASPLFVSANNFNDGEKDRGSTYDLDYRNYDPSIGRLFQIDPSASSYASFSAYHYSFNNPVMFNDPSGADPYYDSHSNDFVSRQNEAEIRLLYADLAGGYGGSQYSNYEYINGVYENAELKDRAARGDMDAAREYGNRNGGLDIYSVTSSPIYSSEIVRSLNMSTQTIEEFVQRTITGYRYNARAGLKFSKLWDDYGHDITHTDKDGKDIFEDHCAINLSEALIQSGVQPGGVQCWGNCSTNSSHSIRAQELGDWLKGNLPGVQVLTGKNFKEKISGKTGIVFFQDYWQRPGEKNKTGDHIDLWNKNEMGSYGMFDTWLRTTIPWLGTLRGMSDLSKSTQVLFWEIK